MDLGWTNKDGKNIHKLENLVASGKYSTKADVVGLIRKYDEVNE